MTMSTTKHKIKDSDFMSKLDRKISNRKIRADKFQYKSELGICMMNKPLEAFVVNIDKNDKEISRQRVGTEPPVRCPSCGKKWSEH